MSLEALEEGFFWRRIWANDLGHPEPREIQFGEGSKQRKQEVAV